MKIIIKGNNLERSQSINTTMVEMALVLYGVVLLMLKVENRFKMSKFRGDDLRTSICNQTFKRVSKFQTRNKHLCMWFHNLVLIVIILAQIKVALTWNLNRIS